MNIVEIYEKLPTNDDCIRYLETIRWKGKPACPYCKSIKTTPLPQEKRHHCNNCNTSFSVTVGTIFHHTRIPLQKWFLAVTIILNAKKGISARQLSRDLKVNKDTAWRIGMKVREAMNQHEQRELLTGIVEADETYVGGKPRKGNTPPGGNKRGRGTKKIAVVGVVERNGNVKAEVFRNKPMTAKNLNALVRRHVDTKNAVLMTDAFKGYLGIKTMMPHKSIDHAVWYVNGEIHTNTIESFWSLLKRGIIGQYHKVSVRHLPKYIDEFCYRWNHNKQKGLFEYTLERAVRC